MDEKAARLFKKVDTNNYDFKIMEKLFGTSNSNIITELNREIFEYDFKVNSFVEEAVDNEEILEWLHSFFDHQCNGHDRCIFEDYYCNLSLDKNKELRYDYEESYLFEPANDRRSFSMLLDEILINERKTSGAPDWWTEDIMAIELNSWKSPPHNVCGNMK